MKIIIINKIILMNKAINRMKFNQYKDLEELTYFKFNKLIYKEINKINTNNNKIKYLIYLN